MDEKIYRDLFLFRKFLKSIKRLYDEKDVCFCYDSKVTEIKEYV